VVVVLDYHRSVMITDVLVCALLDTFMSVEHMSHMCTCTLANAHKQSHAHPLHIVGLTTLLNLYFIMLFIHFYNTFHIVAFNINCV